MSAPRADRGYVLLATLAIVLVMTLLASAIAVTTERAIEDRRRADARLQAEIDATSTASTVLYLLSTQRQTFAGMTVDDRMVMTPDEVLDQEGMGTPISLKPVGNEIRLDGSPYRGLGDIRFSLQDDRGRVSINWLSPAYLTRFLQGLGVAPSAVPPLLAKLKDYQDPDDLFRLNGAEADDYRKAGLPGPSNRAIATPLELRRVLGWREVLAPLSDRQLLASISTGRNGQLNVNTAGPVALGMIPGLDPAAARRAIALRQRAPFSSVYDFARYTGLFLDEDQGEALSTYPGGGGTLDLWSDSLGAVRQIHWLLTPLDDGGKPWRSQYSFVLSLPENPDGLPAEEPGAKIFDDKVSSRR